MPVIAGVALGGALGASARYLLDRVIEQHVDRHHLPAWLRIGLVVGVLGGYTTFSTFSQEIFSLLESNDVAIALAYAGASVGVGLLAVYLGTLLGRSF